MRINNWIKLGLVVSLFSISAMADHDGNHNNNNDNGNGNNRARSFESALLGSVPNMNVGGVVSGGAPWTVASSEVTVSGSGNIKVEVQGLLLTTGAPANLVGTVGTVGMVAASLICGGSGGTVSASTGGVPLSPAGNAEIEATIAVPATCVAPAVLVRIFNNTAPAGTELGPFIAVSGFTASASNTGQRPNDDRSGDH